MAIQAIFPPGQAEITVNGLHQWDYGQLLEIYAADLPGFVEVHFACVGMAEAVVRTGASGGEGAKRFAEVAIPDSCLEQTSPVTAWVYLVGSTSGSTNKTITLPIIARPRPQLPSGTVPEEISDKYTEAVETMNDLVDNVSDLVVGFDERVESLIGELSNGDIPIASVGHAKTADSAAEADYAHEAKHANQAKMDELGQPIHLTYARMASFTVDNVIQKDERIRIGSLPIDSSRIFGFYLETKNGKGFNTSFSVPFLQYSGHRTSEWVDVTAQGASFTQLYLTGAGLQYNKSTNEPHSIVHRCAFLEVQHSYDGGIYFKFNTNKSFQVEGGWTNVLSYDIDIYGETIKTVQILYT